MIDSQTHQRIRVSADGTAGPYIMVPIDRLPHVRERLNRHGIDYWVESDAVSLDGKPAISVINLGRSVDVAKVQEALDLPN